jgi:uncharacterized protein YdeI (YjbR/CyaY-like superfamily)
MNSKVDNYLNKTKNWQKELKILRTIFLDCQLTEELKWGAPCYSYQKNNIAILYAFKNYCGIGFFKGALLSDADKILIKPGEHTQSGRQIRFTSLKEIIEAERLIKTYIFEAVEIEKAGLKIEFKKTEEYSVPEEFQKKLNEMPVLNSAFKKLTPGRQKAYLLYFSAPKQSKTRLTRIEKYTPQIINGKGFSDCTCGLSKKLPYCDGSHRVLQKTKQ